MFTVLSISMIYSSSVFANFLTSWSSLASASSSAGSLSSIRSAELSTIFKSLKVFLMVGLSMLTNFLSTLRITVSSTTLTESVLGSYCVTCEILKIKSSIHRLLYTFRTVSCPKCRNLRETGRTWSPVTVCNVWIKAGSLTSINVDRCLILASLIVYSKSTMPNKFSDQISWQYPVR